MEQFQFRYAEEKDTALILQFIKDLAEYEHMLDEVVATEELLSDYRDKSWRGRRKRRCKVI